MTKILWSSFRGDAGRSDSRHISGKGEESGDGTQDGECARAARGRGRDRMPGRDVAQAERQVLQQASARHPRGVRDDFITDPVTSSTMYNALGAVALSAAFVFLPDLLKSFV